MTSSRYAFGPMTDFKTIYRVSGIPVAATDDDLYGVLLGSPNPHCTPDELQTVWIVEIDLVPCCYDPHTQVAFVQFSKQLAYLAKGDQWQIEVGRYSLNIDKHFEGFTQLYHTPLDRTVQADIIAVTGLAGHAYGSWRGKGNLREMWLRHWFSKKFPRCRTMIYGYNSRLQNDHGFHRVEDFAAGLLEAIATVRRTYEERTRPLVFIGHSLGGVVITQALLKSESSRAPQCGIRFLSQRTCAIVFLATPHSGLHVDDILSHMDENSSRRPLLHSIRTNSRFMASNFTDSIAHIEKYNIPIISCFEQQRSRMLRTGADGRTTRSGDYYTALTGDDACLNTHGVLENKIPIDRDHSSIAKFESREDVSYLSVVSLLERHLANALSMHDCDTLECVTTHGNDIALIQRCAEGLVNIHTGHCLLSRVAGTDCLRLAEYLGTLGHGHCPKRDHGETGTHIAARAGNVGMVKILVLLAPVDCHDRFGQPALHIAAKRADADMLQVLMDAGADVDCRDAENNTALHVETAKGHLQGIALLLQAGANVDAQDKDQNTALHLAMKPISVEIARMLLQAGADVNAKDQVQNTPLHYAIVEGEHGDEEMMVDLLIKNGADVAARNRRGNTPLHHVVLTRHTQTARMLLDRGAPLEARNQTGKTPLQWATMLGNSLIANILVEHGASGWSFSRIGIVMAARRWRWDNRDKEWYEMRSGRM